MNGSIVFKNGMAHGCIGRWDVIETMHQLTSRTAINV
jgi:hypothetical protein